MGQKERLTFFSKVLEGPLQKMTESGGAWTDLYFRAEEVAKSEHWRTRREYECRRLASTNALLRGRTGAACFSDSWKWNCWSSKQSCYSDGPVLASYSLLAISLVLPDKTDRNVFYVR